MKNRSNSGSVKPIHAARAMAWYRAQPNGTKAYLKEHRKLKDMQSITRYWLAHIATVEESEVL